MEGLTPWYAERFAEDPNNLADLDLQVNIM